VRAGHDPFKFDGLHMTRDQGASMALNNIGSGAIIMAGSGMCTGGRVRHHLKQNLPRAESSIVFVGFAANGTLARTIIDGAKEVGIFGERVPVRAHIHTINGFSAHADQQQLLAWQQQTGAARTFLVHGEETAMKSFAQTLSKTQVEMPELNGIEVARRLKRRKQKPRILVLSAYDDPGYIREMLRIGAVGYLIKDEAPERILEAVRGVAQGQVGWVSPQVKARGVKKK